VPIDKPANTLFGRIIQQRLRELGKKHGALETALAKSKTTRQRILNGEARLEPAEFLRLAQFLAFPPAALYEFYDPERSLSAEDGWFVDDDGHFWKGGRIIDADLDYRTTAIDAHRTSIVRESSPGLSEQLWTDRESPDAALRMKAQAFRREAYESGADDHEMMFVQSVLDSPEAIFRQRGYRGRELTFEQQHMELDAVIAMLRKWLVEHQRQRGYVHKPHERAAGG
jgi:hypothetical protein